jgi:hydroxymethylglutaryl-CoA lyase
VELERMVASAHDVGKKAVVYFSMAFGNPYGEVLSDGMIHEALDHMVRIQPDAVSISDTIGSGTPESIQRRAEQALEYLPVARLGMHLHVREDQAFAHLEAAWNAGIRRFDTAMRGIGGCPFAQSNLVGNMPAEKLLTFANRVGASYGVRPMALESAHNEALALFK